MKTWTKPESWIEQFVANEYVAACWTVGCSSRTTYWISESGAPDGSHWSAAERKDSQFNHTGDCTVASNNYFTGNSDGSTIQFILEDNTQQGNLKGGFDYWVDKNNDGIVDTNDIIYWYTDNGTLRWNHWGYVQTTDEAHVNRS